MLCGSKENSSSNGNKLCSRIIFVCLLGLAAILALAIKYFGKRVVLELPWFQYGCVDEKFNFGDDIELVCGGNQAVYRVCLGSGFFFLFMLIVGTISPCFHNGCWVAKLLVFLGFIVACFFIPNIFFTVYYGVALGMSTVFLILQVLLVVDFSYRTDGSIKEKFPDDEDGGGRNLWMCLYLGYCALCVLVSIGAIIAMYVVFSCGPAYGITSAALVVGTLCIILSMVEKFECGLLPGANMALYIVWLTWSGQSSNPSIDCNPYFSTLRLDDIIGVVFAFVITFVSAAWMSMSMHRGILRLCNKQHTMVDNDNDEDDKNAKAQARLDNKLAGDNGELELTDLSKGSNDKSKDKPKDDSSDEPTSCTAERVSILVFHLTLFVASFYVAMICTFWVDATDPATMTTFLDANDNSTEIVVTGSYPAMYAKLGAAGLSFVLFLWTLLTALCCDVSSDS